jgi:hypothetical protein
MGRKLPKPNRYKKDSGQYHQNSKFPDCIGRFPECIDYTPEMEAEKRPECRLCPFK